MAKGSPQDTRSSRVSCSLTTEFSLVQENILLQNERITQLYVIQAEQNPFLWFGVLFVDDGPYLGSVVRFNMYVEETYPDSPCPKIVFYPIPSHPLVNPTTGELDTKNAFPDWNSKSRKFYELLLFVKRVIRQADDYITQIKDLISGYLDANNQFPLDAGRSAPEKKIESDAMIEEGQRSHISKVRTQAGPSHEDDQSVRRRNSEQTVEMFDSSFREMFTWFHHTLDFVKMYVHDHDQFRRRVNEFKEKCHEQLLERPALCGDDQNAIVFTPWDPEVHEPMRSFVLAGRFTPSSLYASYHKDTDSVSFVPGHGPGLN